MVAIRYTGTCPWIINFTTSISCELVRDGMVYATAITDIESKMLAVNINPDQNTFTTKVLDGREFLNHWEVIF